MIRELARIEVRDPPGVFAARQLGREVAAEVGLDHQDEVRVATALSEVSRSSVIAGRTAEVAYGADADDLVVTIRLDGPPPAEGVTSAARLLDVEQDGQVVRLRKRRPAHAPFDAAAARERLATVFPPSALDELRRDNQDLIAALEDSQRRREQLLSLNAELEETNRGVMALYSQVSEELEETNRGVVALYAELDDKSQRLREASEAKNRFWANVSHELRTPLNSIIGLSRLLAEPGSGLGPEQLHQVELIRGSGATLLALVNDLLDVAKAESGRLRVDPAYVNLPALLSRLRGLVLPMAQGKPVTVVVSDEGAPETILTDESALLGILRNLLSNAIKYTDRGLVRLSVRAEGPDLEIAVADTGVGIPASQHRRVFEEFYQAPGLRRGGTGLGLPYARKLAGLLGGGLALDSEPGRGTTVVLRLPNGAPAAGTVLIADDDPRFRAVLRGLLAGVADEVIEAADGAAAAAALSAESVDLVLTDLSMPGVDGYGLLEELPASVPAIIITALDADAPPPAAALLRKDEITRERLAFTIRRVRSGQ